MTLSETNIEPVFWECQMRKKSLKADSNGIIWVNVGWKLTKGGERSQGKIGLGSNLRDAQRRLHRIEELWEHIERTNENPLWDDFTFDIAKQMGKGEIQFPLHVLDGEESDDYSRRLSRLIKQYPSVQFAPADEDSYEAGVKELSEHYEAIVATEAENAHLARFCQVSDVSRVTIGRYVARTYALRRAVAAQVESVVKCLLVLRHLG